MTKRSVVIITGAAGGIGKATAFKFAESGFIPVLVDIDKEALERVSDDLRGLTDELLMLDGDLQDDGFRNKIISETMKSYGRIDVLVNNAAWRSIGTMRTISLEDWKKTIHINLTAPAFLAKYAAEQMEKHRLPGVIVNLSSVMSSRTGGYAPAYTACKGGIESLTYELATLYGPRQIRVVCLAPGNVDTPMSKDYVNSENDNISNDLGSEMNVNTPLLRSAAPSEIANAIYWIASPEASFITGTTMDIDGGFSKNFNSYPAKKRLNSEEF